MAETPTYDWYFSALAGDKPALTADNPQPGFYRILDERPGPNALAPVAIWWDDQDGIVALVGSDEDVCPAIDVWLDACSRPIKESYYRHFMQHGEWPDDPGLAMPKHGSNAPTPKEELADEIESAVSFQLKPIIDDASRDAAQSVRARLLELSRKATKEHEKEKRPHLEAGKAVDDTWKPMIKLADMRADAIRDEMQRYETDQHKKSKESPPAEAAKTKIKGTYGRAASSVVKQVAFIHDILATAKYYLLTDEVRQCLTKLAQKDVDKGYPVPGVNTKDEVRIR